MRNGSIWAAQAFLLFLDWTRSGDGLSAPRLEQAQAAAARAIALDPTSSETHEAMASILLARGQAQAAMTSLARAVELNPSNPELRIKIGWQECLAGAWEAGTQTIRTAMEELMAAPGWYRIPLALDGFRRDDFAAALEGGADHRRLGRPARDRSGPGCGARFG